MKTMRKAFTKKFNDKKISTKEILKDRSKIERREISLQQ